MTKSPKPTKEIKKELTFTEAVTAVLIGKSVTKKEWDDLRYHALLDEERLKLAKPDGKLYDWVLSEADMRGDDYIIL